MLSSLESYPYYIIIIYICTRYSDGFGNGGSRRYGAAFHAAKETVVSGPTDVGHEATGTGGAVPD